MQFEMDDDYYYIISFLSNQQIKSEMFTTPFSLRSLPEQRSALPE
jgi:hypothetical protein